jgi:LCP family protein required for cell wall assembly
MGQQPPARAPRSRRRRWWPRVLGALLLLWLLFLIAVPLWGWNKIDRVDAEPDGDRPGDQPGTTYLIVGSDSREGLDADQREALFTGEGIEGGRTDTIMLLHVGDGQPILLSVPRDSPVEIPGRGTSKINSAFGGEGGGPELLVETIELNTGIRVDDYIEIGFGGFVDIVDGLGGVEICPDSALRDPKAGLDLDAGCQEVNGVTALGYSRSRDFALADLNRVQNQREVIGAIGRKAKSPWTVLNPWRYLQVVGSGTGALTIGDNVGPLSLGRFAWNLAKVSGGSGLSCTVPNTTTTSTLEWDQDRADRLFELIAADATDDIDKQLCTRSGQ